MRANICGAYLRGAGTRGPGAQHRVYVYVDVNVNANANVNVNEYARHAILSVVSRDSFPGVSLRSTPGYRLAPLPGCWARADGVADPTLVIPAKAQWNQVSDKCEIEGSLPRQVRAGANMF